MRRNKTGYRILGCLMAVMLLLGSCSTVGSRDKVLDPEHPVTITVWHYYNGQTKEKFDQLVAQFNDTVGMEKGIVVDAQSQGDVQQLADAVYDAANGKIGSQPLPHIFAAYPDNAYRINLLAELVNIEDYFSKSELKQFRQDFLDEGRFGEGDKLKIIPVAKSTENMYLNKTDWDKFAAETGADLKELSTWEGLARTAQKYYEWTDAKTPEQGDGKAFIGIDSVSNYMLLSTIQQGKDLYDYQKDGVKLNFDEAVAYKVWENYYVPYFKGYYTKTGRFCSDDAKTGTVLAYIGSTAGAGYFPTEVTLSQSEVYPIEALALAYPYFEKGKSYAIQQGAGMCITKSDEAHEYAAAVFLKWFTNKEQNVEFAVSTGYFPVKNEALKEEILLEARQKVDGDTPNATITKSIKTTAAMLKNYTLYGNRPFEGSYDMRKLLESSLFAQVQKDLKLLEEGVQKGENKEQLIKSFVSEEGFKAWYQQFMKEAEAILK